MQVKLQSVSKVFQHHSVFKNVNLDLPMGYRGVILGGNGSGKSTLLKVISTALVPTKGSVVYTEKEQVVEEQKRHKKVAFCAPYTDLIEDFTLEEHIQFQGKFRPFLHNITAPEIIERLQLARFKDKPIKTYSSGMRQRVRLILAVAADTPLLLLDEPTSNLDPNGKKWFAQLIEDFGENRTILVGSNFLEEEYFFANNTIALNDFK